MKSDWPRSSHDHEAVGDQHDSIAGVSTRRARRAGRDRDRDRHLETLVFARGVEAVITTAPVASAYVSKIRRN